jgi:proteasome lid subunit RPN8/RPN11
VSAEPTSHAPPAKPEKQHSLWESPDHSVAIYLTFEVIDAINQALTQMAAAAPVRGAEIGGLLLGRSEQSGPLTVWIDRFEPVPCGYPRGASWMLTEDEQDDLADRLAEPRESHVVGFFRSHTRKDLFLSEDDTALFSHFFADHANVFLLVKPFTTRPNLGGFFYWEGASIHRAASRQEFPFHRRELGGGEPAPVVAPPPQAWVRTEEKNVVAVAGTAADFETPMFLREDEPQPRPRFSLLAKLGVVLGLATLGVAGYTAYVHYGRRSLERMLARQNPARAVAPPEGTLRLSASEGEKSITLTWDRTSPIVAAATRGTVEITEGSFHKSIEMSPDDLRAGRVVYSRPEAIGDTVSFRMQLNTGQGEPFSEAVRFVSRKAVPSVMPPAIMPPAIMPPAIMPPAIMSAVPTPKPPTAAQPQPLTPPPAIAEIKTGQLKPAAVALPAPPVEVPKVAPPKVEAPKILRPAPRREP